MEGVISGVGRVGEELGARAEVATVAEEHVGGRRQRLTGRWPQQMMKKATGEA
jgi:hypothetical protein